MKLCERFINYAKIHTTSNPESAECPSFSGEWDLAAVLAKELSELGAVDVKVSDHCYVTAKIPATEGLENCKKLGFIAHMDTSDAVSGKGVSPQIWENYNGGALDLGQAVLDPAMFPTLLKAKGKTLITSDGSTLLGADDKAGIAEIMDMLAKLQVQKIPHGPLRIGFTPDEEIGAGTDYFDVADFDADFAYTADGGEAGEFEYQNFNAAQAVITIKGRSVHPGYAKSTMLNAQNIAFEFHALIPQQQRPEYTEGTEGFYHLCSINGDVTNAKLVYIIRDHSKELFEQRKELIKSCAVFLNQKYPDGTVTAEMSDSYYNMEEKIVPHMHLIENAKKAIQSVGLQPVVVPVRGGTDGAMLSFKGLPCPNLGTGHYNAHGVYEFAVLEQMETCVEILLHLVKLYSA